MTRRFAAVLGVTSLLFLTMIATSPWLTAADEGDSALVAMADPAVQEQTKGPVHEAFEKPVQFNPTPGITVDRKPNELIEELAPEEKPEGENVTWIGGYWGWDESRNDFLWISGFWRNIPAGREWKGGYWKKLDDEEKWQWYSGFWANVEEAETEYQPTPPPDTLEAGPTTEAPSEEYIWSPGTWVYHETRYAWRPGYWIMNHPGWVWHPAYWVCTPCGYVLVDGYWDYSVRRRGMLFAPCYFDTVVFSRPSFYYRPRVVIDVDILTDHFFCFPRYHHYCFGDYYATSYVSVGITPWFSFHYSRGCYSPSYAYYHCHFRRHDHQWEHRLRERHNHLRVNVASRPATTFVAMHKTVIKSGNKDARAQALAKPLKDVSQLKGIKMAKVDANEQKALVNKVKESRKTHNERVKLESTAAVKTNQPKDMTKPLKLNLPKSPVASKVSDDPKLTKGLPPKPKTTRIDSSIKTKNGTTQPTLDPKTTKLPKGTVDPKTTKTTDPKTTKTTDPKSTTKTQPSIDPNKIKTTEPKTKAQPTFDPNKVKTTKTQPTFDPNKIKTTEPRTKAQPTFDPNKIKTTEPKTRRAPTDPTTIEPKKKRSNSSSEGPVFTPNSTTFPPTRSTERKSSDVKSFQSVPSTGGFDSQPRSRRSNSEFKSSPSFQPSSPSKPPPSREEKKGNRRDRTARL